MGAQLSVSQKSLYYQVVGILSGREQKFKKSEAQKFARWLSLHFPDVSAQKLLQVSFWDRVGNEILRLGDPSLSKFTYLALQIRNIVKNEMQRQPSNDKLFPSSQPGSSHPTPLSSPAAPRSGILRGATRHSVQGCHRLPGSPQNSHDPRLGSPGQTARDLSCPPVSPKCTAPSQKPTVRFHVPDPISPQNGPQEAQNGGRHAAFPATCPSSSCDPPPSPPQSPILPEPNPFRPSGFPASPTSPPTVPPISSLTPPDVTIHLDTSSPNAPPTGPVVVPSGPTPDSHGSHDPPSGSHALFSGAGGCGNPGLPDTLPTLSAAPVPYVPQPEGRLLAQWSPIPQQTIKEL
ncbi:uncharacterized protein LOC128802178 [Vidua chalybeata]|uniref:uncharacterized protein LOC128802178 n=1 Tax=Vidua chalybeata TaxID=81927 RepID=UPI0023A85004|nr:uncharacterized protein LOC128802178 [Vidua chalybeata]XP_053824396.1 uncharacterized protein LOC128802178 [Vidua chalybeata]